MDLKKKFGTDRTLEEEGVWVDLGDGAEIKVARINNRRYKEVTRRLMAPHKRLVRAGKLSDDVAEKLLIEAMATTILLDWKGIEVDGETIAYSRENAIKLLTELPDFREFVSSVATEMDAFRAEEEAEEEKN